jgi:hypothetical protein
MKILVAGHRHAPILKEIKFEFRFWQSDNTVRVIAARGRPFYNQGKDIVLGMFIDITPQGQQGHLAPAQRDRNLASESNAERAPSGTVGTLQIKWFR